MPSPSDRPAEPNERLFAAIRAGVEAAQSGDNARAHRLFRAVLDQDPTNEAAWLWYASTAQDPHDALRGVRFALRLNPDNTTAAARLPEALVAAGVAAARAQDRTAALELLTEATAQDPNNESAWHWLACVTDDPDKAARHWERVLRLNPANPDAKRAVARSQSRAAPEVERPCPICGHRSRDQLDTICDTCPRCGAVRVLHRPELFDRTPPSLNRPLVEAAVSRLKTGWSVTPVAAAAYALGLAYLNLGQGDAGVAALQTALRLPGANRAWAAELANLIGHRQGRAADDARTAASAPRVFLVDDCSTLRRAVAVVLAEAGYRVTETASAEAAAAELRRTGPPDLFLLEVELPGADGLALCEALRADTETAAVPVAFLTRRTGFFSRRRARRAGAAEYLTKPFAVETLLATAARLVANRTPPRA